MVKKWHYGNECFGLTLLYDLEYFYTILNTLIRSWILLYDLERSKAKHLQQFYHLIGPFWSVLSLKPHSFLHINVPINVLMSIKACFIEFFECHWKMNRKRLRLFNFFEFFISYQKMNRKRFIYFKLRDLRVN